MSYIIRDIKKEDISRVLEIYTPYITDTCITFETVIPSLEDFERRVYGYYPQYPYLVCEDNGCVVGYAYASPYGERAAYKYSADVSVYVAIGHTGSGAGSALFRELFPRMKTAGIYTAYSAICVPNEKSVALHESFGFKKEAVFKSIGYKQGKWLDLLWMSKQLCPYSENPGLSPKDGLSKVM